MPDRHHSKNQDPSTRPKTANGYPEARILVAEDTAIGRKMLRHQLAGFGIIPTVVPNGAVAVEAVRTRPFDLIFMDLEMPVMDGTAATRSIREWEAHGSPATRPAVIIGLTAHTGRSDQAHQAQLADYTAMGFDRVFAKPLSRQCIAEILAFHLPHTAQAGVAAPAAGDTPAAVDSGLLEMDAAIRKIGGDPRLYRSLVRIFRSHSADACAQIQRMLEQGNIHGVRHTAHSLKGSALTIGATGVSRFAEALERTAMDRNHPEAVSILAQLKMELSRLGDAFDRVLGADTVP